MSEWKTLQPPAVRRPQYPPMIRFESDGKKTARAYINPAAIKAFSLPPEGTCEVMINASIDAVRLRFGAGGAFSFSLRKDGRLSVRGLGKALADEGYRVAGSFLLVKPTIDDRLLSFVLEGMRLRKTA